ncbi:hypothetical protein Moror_3401 [Moniliophthora roreri MCA 2997]|uniref:Uncharacterized protein n=1 Tax=Moniliophthora roreri (strain MCA 2997) TaxID=1381753 RepID=V2X380_MONRO|nr:hypothetical protein Moror_3401 [Moniliophthora roreri MCA 2997]
MHDAVMNMFCNDTLVTGFSLGFGTGAPYYPGNPSSNPSGVPNPIQANGSQSSSFVNRQEYYTIKTECHTRSAASTSQGPSVGAAQHRQGYLASAILDTADSTAQTSTASCIESSE